MVPVDGGDDVPAYVTQKMVYPVKHIGEESADGSGDVLLVTTVATRYFDADGTYLKEFDKLERFTDGEYVDSSPNDMMDLSELVEE
jgi:hypothetical protein